MRDDINERWVARLKAQKQRRGRRKAAGDEGVSDPAANLPRAAYPSLLRAPYEFAAEVEDPEDIILQSGCESGTAEL